MPKPSHPGSRAEGMRREYVVRLAPSPGWSPYSEPRRLARALKALGRAYGFKCIGCVRICEPAPRSEERAA